MFDDLLVPVYLSCDSENVILFLPIDDTQTPTQVDTKAPTITINGFVLAKYNKLPRNCPYQEKGAEAVDAVDGDLTAEIQINTSQVDTSIPGTYKVWYSVADSAGNTAKVFHYT